MAVSEDCCPAELVPPCQEPIVPLCFYPSIPATVAQWLGRSAAEPKGAGSIPRRGGRFSLGAEGTLGQMHPLPWCLMLPMLPSLVHRKPWHSDLLEEPVCLMAMLVVCQQEVGAAAPPCRLANSFQAEPVSSTRASLHAAAPAGVAAAEGAATDPAAHSHDATVQRMRSYVWSPFTLKPPRLLHSPEHRPEQQVALARALGADNHFCTGSQITIL